MQILSYLFALYIYDRDFQLQIKVPEVLPNIALPRMEMEQIAYVENKVLAMEGEQQNFFYDMLDLLSSAYEAFYNNQQQTAYLDFFKVVESIAKKYYCQYPTTPPLLHIKGKIDYYIRENAMDSDARIATLHINLIKNIRNAIAHDNSAGTDTDSFDMYLAECEYLCIQMFSNYFFQKSYLELHICSYRYTDGEDIYTSKERK